MSFGKLKRALKGIINRRDLTEDLAGDFINRAITEAERVLRLGAMEAVLETTFNGEDHAITIPGTYLEMIDLFTMEGTLEQVEKDRFFAEPPGPTPRVYMKVGAQWLVKPTPSKGTVLWAHFYTETDELKTDTDANVWTRAGFDAVLYASASLAADYFQMEDQYVSRFQARSDQFLQAMREQDLSEKYSGPMSIPAPRGLGEY